MWTEDVEINIIVIPRRNCFEGGLPSACYQERLLDLTYASGHLEIRGTEKVSRAVGPAQYSRPPMNIISPHSLRIERLHYSLENIF
jgi:hypothetical protein